ncbi:MAG: type II secretion system protein GspJ [Myxococcota bacterium]
MTKKGRSPLRPQRKTKALTLIEALIAISILSIVATMVWSGFSQTTRNKRIVERSIDRQHVIASALERMARELSMAFVSVHLNDNPALQTVRTAFVGTDRGARDRIDFTSFSHQRLYRNAHESEQNELSYFVMRHPEDTSQNILARREQNRIDEDPERGGRVELLVEGVESLELSYFDPLSNLWVNSWDTTQTTGQPNRLPAQVKILLTVTEPTAREDRERTRTYGTRAVLPMVHALNHAVYQ